MTLSTNGKRIGAARSAERADEREYQVAAAKELKLNVGDAMNELRQLAPLDWERWYDANIPETATHSQILRIVRERIEFLRERAQVRDYLNGLPASTRAFLDDVHRNVLAHYQTKPLGDTKTARTLDDLTDEERREWFDNQKEIPF